MQVIDRGREREKKTHKERHKMALGVEPGDQKKSVQAGYRKPVYK